LFIDVSLGVVSSFDDWRRLRASTSRADFEALHPYAFLVSIIEPGVGLAPRVEKVEHGTPAHDTDTQNIATALEEPIILALKKPESNPFPERISFGRAPNCDVVIGDPSVSKLHGHFRDVRREAAWFTDAKSSNGTLVDGTFIQAGVPVELRRRTQIAFGRVRLVLVSASDVYDLL
jgi:hypothetical protein